MKSVFAIVIFFSTFAHAFVSCPGDIPTVHICKSTPKAGDSELASGVFDAIAVCGTSTKLYMVLAKGSESQMGAAKIERRAGGVSYSVSEDDIVVSLSLPTGIGPKPVKMARMSITMKKAHVTASSTYTCK